MVRYMVKKELVSKAEFARRAGVVASAVTAAIATGLSVAMEGKRINANHEAAVAYLQEKTAPKMPPPATGIDPLYETAVEQCGANGRYTSSNISRSLRIGYARAKRILAMMNVAGVVPAPGVTPPPPPPPPPRGEIVVPPERGYNAKNRAKKTASLQKLMEEGDTLHEIPEDIRAFADMTLRELIGRFGTDIAFLDWLKATKAIEDINEKRLKNAQTKGELVSREVVKIGIIDPINAAHIKMLTDGAKTIARRVTAMHGAGRPLADVEKFIKDQITSFIRPVKSKVARALKNA